MPNRLTIIQLLPALHGGGVERAALEVATEAVQRGHRALVIAAGGRLSPALSAVGAEHIDWNIGRKSLTSLRWIKPLRRCFIASGAHIVHARSRLPAWLAYWAWRTMPPQNRPAFVTTVHGLYSVNPYSTIMTRGEAVIAVSKTVRDYILEHYPNTDPARIQLIYNGLEASEFPYGYRPSVEWLSAWEREFPQTVNRRLLSLPGRLTRRKGHEDFLRLLAALKTQSVPVHGLIVGGFEGRERYLSELIRLANQLGLAENKDFTCTGPRSDIRDIYAHSSIVLSLSTKPESFGRTVLEALSLGVPVVAYEHGGVGEILHALFPQGGVTLGNANALQERCVWVLRERPTIAPHTQFSRRQMLDDTFALYQRLAERS